jgi:hypothetical protein
MRQTSETCRNRWLNATTLHQEVVAYGELLASGEITWEDLLVALERAKINAEDAAMRLHVWLDIPKRDDRLILAQDFWRHELAKRNIATSELIKADK